MMQLDGHQKNIMQMISSPLVRRSRVVVWLQAQRMLLLHNPALCGMKHLATIMIILLGSTMMEIQVFEISNLAASINFNY